MLLTLFLQNTILLHLMMYFFKRQADIYLKKIMLKEVSWKNMLNMASNINIRRMETLLGRLYALWLREFKVFLREHSRLIAATFTPLLWLFVIGSGFGSVLHPSLTTNTNYQKFIFPGIISMSIIFSSVFFGSYII
jgi:hypothetical protein